MVIPPSFTIGLASPFYSQFLHVVWHGGAVLFAGFFSFCQMFGQLLAGWEGLLVFEREVLMTVYFSWLLHLKEYL